WGILLQRDRHHGRRAAIMDRDSNRRIRFGGDLSAITVHCSRNMTIAVDFGSQ
ncbi:hypothetical protein HAX54_026951, partial [Datura stramonium]|nr:hypothetical protein [Datura stramonium]